MEKTDKTIAEKREKTDLILSNIYNLPALPKALIEVNRLLENPNATATELSKVISQDQALVSKILSIANSPLYGLPRKVSTIDFAILIIGFNDIKNIVMALSLMEAFKNKSDKNLNQMDFWTHSVVTATASKRIAEDLGYRIGGEAFVVGLLHDLGIPVIHKYLHSNFLAILEMSEKEQKRFFDCEIDIMGMDHQEIGKFLAYKWNLPLEIVDSILNHHQPSKASENKVLTSIAHLADYMSNTLVDNNYFWDKGINLDESVIDYLRFSNREHLENFISGYKDLCLIQTELMKS